MIWRFSGSLYASNCCTIVKKILKQSPQILDLDIDSQGDGANAVMSGLESESESDCIEAEDEFPETQYIHCPEEEFGAVI